jgi:hypothetical protein
MRELFATADEAKTIRAQLAKELKSGFGNLMHLVEGAMTKSYPGASDRYLGTIFHNSYDKCLGNEKPRSKK